MSVSLAGFSPEIVNLIQQNVLVRTFNEALFPRLLFRAEAFPERWDANVGESKIFTRSGRMPVSTTPLQPGTDPTPKVYGTEQFRVEACQYGDRLQTHMPTSRAQLASKFLLDVQKLGQNAGETLNLLNRNRLYQSYLAGDTLTIDAAGAAATNLHVASINGFTEVLVNGGLTGVTPGTPLAVETGPANDANTVISAVPDNPNEPFGPGTITLGTPLAGALAARSRVRTLQRSRINRVGGAASVDALTVGSIITVNDLIAAVQTLRSQNVPPHSDGRYHVHMPSEAVTQIFLDNQWQRLYQSLPDEAPYRNVMIGATLASFVYENTECPNALNSGVLRNTGTNARVAPEVGGEVINETGVPIARTIVTGGGSIYEEYIPEDEYITPAGVNGQVGAFTVTANGVAVNTARIRYILRAPQDVLQQVLDHAWSWSGDFAIPTDLLTGNGARFKRAVVIEHAGVGV